MPPAKIGRTKHKDLAIDTQAYIQSAAANLFSAMRRITDIEAAKLISAATHDLQMANQASEEIIDLITAAADDQTGAGGPSYATQFAELRYQIEELERRFADRIAELEQQYQLRDRA